MWQRGFFFHAASDPLAFEPTSEEAALRFAAILYDTDDGRLYYDPRAGGTGERLLAEIFGAPTITEANITF